MAERILLFHWNAAEAEERADILRRAGYAAETHSGDGSADALRLIRARPPQAFVIDLGRVPSSGRAVAAWLRETKATRMVPIVFIEGDPEKTERVRSLFPDAAFTDWRRIRGALRRALRGAAAGDRRAEPVRPGIFAGYAGAPLPKKLGVREGTVLLLLDAPGEFERTLGPLPDGVSIRRQARGQAPVILLFARNGAALTRRFPTATRALAEGGRIWLAWPKKSSDLAADLSERSVRAFGLGCGFVDFKICAIDATWSGLCFVCRGGRRPGGAQRGRSPATAS